MRTAEAFHWVNRYSFLTTCTDLLNQETVSLPQRSRRQSAVCASCFHRNATNMKTSITKRTKATTASIVPLPINSILVPLDFSSPSKKALDFAVAFARQFKAKLTLLHVVEPVAMPDFAASFPQAMENDKLMAAARNELERTVKMARIPRGTVEKVLVRSGRSFHEIADAARTRKVDLIIISTHGYTGLKHALLGSTAERVVRHASCPVLVVRPR